MGNMKKYFLAGLVTLLPLAITVWMVSILVRFLTKPFLGIATHFFAAASQKIPFFTEKRIELASELLILLFLFFFTWSLGYLARKFFIRSLLRFGDRILCRIPVIRTVYKTSKDIIQALFSSKGRSLQQVVLLPFPYKGSYCLGLVASPAPKDSSKATSLEMVSVFIPTTPNPTSGFLTMVPKQDLLYLSMKSEEAIQYVVSCGVIQPGSSKGAP